MAQVCKLVPLSLSKGNGVTRPFLQTHKGGNKKETADDTPTHRGLRTCGSPADDLIRTYKREKHVYDEVLKNSKKFNEAELDHAKWIIDDAIEKGERAGINLNEL